MQENFGRQSEVLDYFRGLGIRYACGAPAYNSTVNHKTPVPILLSFAQHFVSAFYHAKEIGLFYQTHLMVNFDEEVDCYCRACSKPVCPQLTSDGYVSCCDWASFGPKVPAWHAAAVCLRDVGQGERRIIYFQDNKARIEDRTIETLGRGACKGCAILKHCAGGCIGKVMVKSKDMHQIDPNWCSAAYLSNISRETGTMVSAIPEAVALEAHVDAN